MPTRLLAIVLLASAAHAASAPPPAQLFFDNPGIGAAQLSPDGKRVAIRAGERGKRDRLAVVDAETGDTRAVASFHDLDIDNFQWVNSERLLFDTTDRRVARGELKQAPGLFAINHDGSAFRELGGQREVEEAVVAPLQATRIPRKPDLLAWNHYMLRQRGAQNSHYAYISSPSFDSAGEISVTDLKKLDTLTGRTELVARPAHVRDSMLDQLGEPRLAFAIEGGQETIHYRDPATGAWRRLTSFHAYTGGAGAFEPLGFGPDGTLYVVANAGKDKRAVHVFDLATGKIAPEAMIASPEFDFRGTLLSGSTTLGVQITTDTHSTIWFDARMKAVQ